AWSPFQDFNSEHINHFSLASLANLMRQCGFRPVTQAAKEILSAPEMPYPAIFCFAEQDPHVTPAPEKDVALKGALLKYVERSARLMKEIDGLLAEKGGGGCSG